MRYYLAGALAGVIVILCSGCGPTEFSSTAAQSKASSAADESGGAVNQAGSDSADGSVLQVTVPDFVGMLPGQPTDVDELRDVPGEVGQIAKQARCYVSGGGGHGVDVCLPGSKEAISGLQPIEIRGDQLCVPVETLAENAALFAAGTIGECAGAVDDCDESDDLTK